MKQKNINKTLQSLKKQLDQDLVVHVAVSQEGNVDILGIQCLGKKPKRRQQLTSPSLKMN